MKIRLTPHLVTLTHEAALRSFWRKRALSSFLASSHISLPVWPPEETKRDYLSRLFDSLGRSDTGPVDIVRLARNLAEQATFPDLEGWEDSEHMIRAAKSAVADLRSYLSEQDEQVRSEQQREAARAKARESQDRIRASQQGLQSLEAKLNELAKEMGSPSAGRGFEKWFYDLMDFSEIIHRRRYRTEGREVDGAVTIGDTTYLVECKFTTGQTKPHDIDALRTKVENGADNTMGIFISMSGYTRIALDGASGKRTTLLLLDYTHLYRVLRGTSSFKDLVERIRRHASQTGKAYLPVDQF